MSAEKLLNEDDLKELTGATYASVQKAVLRKNGIFYIERNDDSITTTWHHVNNPKFDVQIDCETPNFEVIK